MHTMLITCGLIRNTNMDDVIMGKFSAQIPGRDGVMPKKGAEEDATVNLLGARSNQLVLLLYGRVLIAGVD